MRGKPGISARQLDKPEEDQLVVFRNLRSRFGVEVPNTRREKRKEKKKATILTARAALDD
jgi:hypothetical protein